MKFTDNIIKVNKVYLALALVLITNILFSQSQSPKKLVAEIFSDHMILQRDVVVPIWGWGNPGKKVEVLLNTTKFSSVVNTNGKWLIELPKANAGGPHKIKISSEEAVVSLEDIYYGDVWLCSGQSNIEWPLKRTKNATITLTDAPYRNIRHLKIPKSASIYPAAELTPTKGWKIASQKELVDFSAVGFYFAQHLQKEIDVPIGLLNSSWGGSKIVSWMDYNALGLETKNDLADTIMSRRELLKQKQIKNFKKVMDTIPFKELGLDSKGGYLWKTTSYDDSHWKVMKLPSPWEKRGLDGLDGVVWFRKSFYIDSVHLENANCNINLGAIDDTDDVYINGKHVGGMKNTWNVVRKYSFSPKLLKSGQNTIAIRVRDDIQRGGFQAKDSLFYLQLDEKKVSLVGDWKFKVAHVFSENLGKEDFKTPGTIYNKMIYPLHKFPIKGILWYQGESDAHPKEAFLYRDRFKAMIKNWRDAWNDQKLPFLFVQLANFMQPNVVPQSSNWAMLRESQNNALGLPYTAQAVIIDLGEAKNIHPENKKDVGYRLSLAAQAIAYGKSIAYRGPTYFSHKKEGSSIIIEYTPFTNKLMTKDGVTQVNEFALAGSDKKFYNAKAILKNNKVIVYSDEVPDPVAVRYAWSDNPSKVNLYDKEGLPAVPFRTDDWED